MVSNLILNLTAMDSFCLIDHFLLFFFWQKSICLAAAVSLNFLPQPGHYIRSSFIISVSSTFSPLANFI